MELSTIKTFLQNEIVLEAINSDMWYEEFIDTIDNESKEEQELLNLYKWLEIIDIICDEPWLEEWDEEFVNAVLRIDWNKIRIWFIHIIGELRNELTQFEVIL